MQLKLNILQHLKLIKSLGVCLFTFECHTNCASLKQLNFNKRIIKSTFGLDISFFNVVEFDHFG